jgi:DNA-directed RNA polymerase subunit D
MTTIKQLKTKGNIYAFHLQNTTPAFANALRRIMIEAVPAMAIEDVEIRKNSSVLYDEIIAHRLGLLALKTDLKTYTVHDDCSCEGEGCAKCTTTLTLSIKGPCTVHAKDLKPQDPTIQPIHPETPIAKLLKGQEIEIIATVKLGRGKDHAKWSPCLAWYTYESDIEVKNDTEQLEKHKHKYPQAIFDKNGNIDKKKIIDLNLTEACDGVCDALVKVNHNPESILFYVEPWGQLPVKQIVHTALDILKSELQAFEKAL